jgi:hypothetical protein
LIRIEWFDNKRTRQITSIERRDGLALVRTNWPLLSY